MWHHRAGAVVRRHVCLCGGGVVDTVCVYRVERVCVLPPLLTFRPPTLPVQGLPSLSLRESILPPWTARTRVRCISPPPPPPVQGLHSLSLRESTPTPWTAHVSASFHPSVQGLHSLSLRGSTLTPWTEEPAAAARPPTCRLQPPHVPPATARLSTEPHPPRRTPAWRPISSLPRAAEGGREPERGAPGLRVRALGRRA